MKSLQLVCAAIVHIIISCEAANILYAIPFAATSHYNALKPLGLELAARGHNVTVITARTEKEHPKSYHQVVADSKLIWDLLGMEKPNIFSMVNYSTETFHEKIIWAGGAPYTELALNSTSVQDLLKTDIKFDLVISEIFFNEAFFALAHKYNTPLVLVSTFGNCMRQNIMSRNPLQQASMIHEYLSVQNPDSFFGRLRNFYFSFYEYFWWRFSYLNGQEELVRKYLPDLPQPVPTLYELQQNASLILYNSHFSHDGAMAYLPNIIEVGGMHLSESKNKLPKDLQEIMDNAKHGIVYVNFGSNVQSSELPDEKRQAFLNVFSKLKETVIWKWEEDVLENKPSNVIIRKWFPQKEMLTHPNIKVFISHGGLIGTQEALYHGVPIVGIPVFADQYNNVLRVQMKGFGRVLQFQDLNEETLTEVLSDVLKDNSFREKAKEASRRFKDRPMSPLDTAVYWVEYVLRNKGAEYMKNPALKMLWIEYTMLDVYAFIVVTILIVLYTVIKFIKLFKLLLKESFQNQKNSQQKKKNKKKD